MFTVITAMDSYCSTLTHSVEYTLCPKNVPCLPCTNFEICEMILIIFGRNITGKFWLTTRIHAAVWLHKSYTQLDSAR